MPLGGDYGSPEKEAIRSRLWDASLEDLIENEGRMAEELRLLDLPGARCVYLHHVVEHFGLAKQNIVGVERLEPDYLAIHHFLGGRGVALRGDVEDLCERGELESYFPFDVVNLDFCGQGFVFPDLKHRDPGAAEYQRRWDCIKYAMAQNLKHQKPSWYLLLTLACAPHLNNKAGAVYLRDQLGKLGRITGYAKDPATWKIDRLVQEVVPFIIADEALDCGYVASAEHLDSYRYVQTGHRYEMVAWRFRLDLDGRKPLGGKTERRKELLDAFCKAYFAEDGKELVL